MPLFQHSVLNKYLSGIDEKQVDEAWDIFTAHFHNKDVQENIREAKEESYQEGFLDDLFVKVLGYTKSPAPNYNLVVEQKNLNDSKKADGALLDGEKIRGVIELKGTETTDLSKVESQAFGYKNKQPDSLYVIISNFEKLRFYIDNAVDFLEFNLFTLTKKDFKVLWLCLGFPNFAKGLPKKIKDASLTEEENVTKKLYKDYSEFKHDIFESVKKHNPDYDPLLLFKKTQKLLDRFLFIFFAEDRNLLPPNSIKKIIQQWHQLKELDEYRPLYERFVKYFGYLNEGRNVPGKDEIFAYNGGLFAEDDILDALTISDDLLYKHTLRLSNYDFVSEVDVNILGHIFEHSLNEIEEINAELKGEEVDASKTRRKKDGVFYTPTYITKYIVEHTVGKLCEEKKAELEIDDEEYRPNRQKKTKKDLLAKLDDYREWLLDLTVCDPACGSGAFLNQALEFLIAEHGYIDELKGKILNQPLELSDIDNQILERNLFGVDINEESVEIAKLSLWLRTARKGRKLTSLNNHIKCGNSLIDDPEVAGDKAFDWNKEFPAVFRQKEKQAYHVTWVTHNARTSQRMKQFGVEKGAPFLMSDEQEAFITREIARMVEEDGLNVMAYNICKDHVHMLLVCEPDELSNIVRKLKGRSSQKLKEALGIPKEEKFQLWAQKFNRNPITDRDGLANVQQYIFHNRRKHGLPPLDGDELDLKDPSWEGKLNSDSEPGDEETTNQEKGLQQDQDDNINPNRDKGLQPLVLGSEPLASGGKSLSEVINELCLTEEEAFHPEYTGGFDVVIGNPPYVVYIKSVFGEEVVDYVNERYSYAEYNPNTYALFTDLGLGKILKTKGRLGFIIPNSWMEGKYFSRMRKELYSKNVDEIVYLKDTVFDEIVETLIILVENIKTENEYIRISEDIIEGIYDEIEFNKEKLSGGFNPFISKENALSKRLEEDFKTIDDFAIVYRGLETRSNDKWLSEEKESDRHKPILLGRDVVRYSYEHSGTFVDFIKDEMKSNANLEMYEQPKILMRRTGSDIIAAVDFENRLALKNLYLIIPNEDVNIYCLVAALNSKLLNYLHTLRKSGENKAFAQFSGVYVKSFPYKNSDDKNFEFLVNKITEQTGELNKHTDKFLELIVSKFDIEKLSRKLQSWHELTFKQFLKELKKKKVELSLDKEAEWLDYFTQQKSHADALKTQIAQTDAEIDAMVYELYGLGEEEVRVVEGG